MTLATTILALAFARCPTCEQAAWAILLGVDPALVYAVAKVESGHVPERHRDRVRGPGGRGRLQIHPQWTPRFGCDAARSRTCNLATGTALLREHLVRTHWDTSAALAIYNDGRTGTVKGALYARRVLREWRRFRRGGTT